jgi:hypothetical protein
MKVCQRTGSQGSRKLPVRFVRFTYCRAATRRVERGGASHVGATLRASDMLDMQQSYCSAGRWLRASGEQICAITSHVLAAKIRCAA